MLVAEGLDLPSDPRFSRWIDLRRRARRQGAQIRHGALVESPALDLSREIGRPERAHRHRAGSEIRRERVHVCVYAAEAPRKARNSCWLVSAILDGIFAERAVLLDRIRPRRPGPSELPESVRTESCMWRWTTHADSRSPEASLRTMGKCCGLTSMPPHRRQPVAGPIYSLDHPQPKRSTGNPGAARCGLSIASASSRAIERGLFRNVGQSRAAFRTAYALPQAPAPHLRRSIGAI